MAQDWRDRLRALMVERGLNMKQLSATAGLGLTAVKDMLDRGQIPSVERFARVAEVLGVSLAELYEGGATPAPKVAVLGIASAGEGWIPPPDEADAGFEPVELSVTEGEAVAILVRGDSMQPRYQDGDVLIGARRAGRAVDNLIGLDCIVETADGERYVKFLARGTSRGAYNLRSRNPNIKDVENVKLAWAAPVVWVRIGRR